MIRKAEKKDAKTIAKLLMIAMQDIVYQFIKSSNYEAALEFLTYFIAKEKTNILTKIAGF